MWKKLKQIPFRELFHKAFDFFLDTFEEIISLYVAGKLLVGILTGSAQVTTLKAVETILLVVWLIALSNIRYKYGHKRLSQTLSEVREDLNRRIFDPIRAENLFGLKSEPTKLFFRGGKEIYIAGITLVKTVGKHHETITDLLVEGANIKILLLKTSSDSVKQLNLRSWGPTKRGYYNTRIKATNDQLKVIADKITTSGSSHGSLSVGYVPFVPSFGITMVNPKKSSGQGWIEIYHHRTDDSGPHFFVSASADKRWFAFFRRQFEEMWKSAEHVVLLRSRK